MPARFTALRIMLATVALALGFPAQADFGPSPPGSIKIYSAMFPSIMTNLNISCVSTDPNMANYPVAITIELFDQSGSTLLTSATATAAPNLTAVSALGGYSPAVVRIHASKASAKFVSCGLFSVETGGHPHAVPMTRIGKLPQSP